MRARVMLSPPQEYSYGANVLAECVGAVGLNGDSGQCLSVAAVLHGDGQLAFGPEMVQDGDPVLDALMPEFVL